MRAVPIAVALALACVATHAPADTGAVDGNGFADRFQLLGQVAPRAAAAIPANNWSVGTEAIDRDYSTYDKWRTYLGPLGVKHARLQSGWQRTDAGGGRYDFRWIDPILAGMNRDGVRPWLSLSYGNDHYAGGGTGRRDSALPTGAGRTAWLAYVTAVARRYRGQVDEFELWNEPDLNPLIDAAGYGRFAYDTYRAVKAGNPRAEIIFGAFAGAWHEGSPARAFAHDALATFLRLGGKAKALTYHSYAVDPDMVYPSVESFVRMVHALDPTIEVRQGENGAPSLNQPTYALSNLWWTEESQAKWLLRRMLGDAGHGIPTSIFSLTEMHYPTSAETNLSWQRASGDNRAITTAKHFKGLLETRHYAPGTAQDDRTVTRTKAGYVAMQAVTALVDARDRPLPDACTVKGRSDVAVYALRRPDGQALVAVWRAADAPGSKPLHELVDVRCSGLAIGAAPVYVDPLTRAVYATRDIVAREQDRTLIRDLPIYDSPVIVVDASRVTLR